MKKITIIVIVCFVIFSLLITGGIIICGNISNNFKKLKNEQFGTISLHEVKDGVYFGSFHCFPLTAEVNVTISSHQITKIDILKHENGKGEAAEAVVDAVVEEQTLEVDAITGATYSSKIILLAIEDALKNAVEQSRES